MFEKKISDCWIYNPGGSGKSWTHGGEGRESKNRRRVLWNDHWAHELLATVVMCTRPTPDWACQHFLLHRGEAQEAPSSLFQGLSAVDSCWWGWCISCPGSSEEALARTHISNPPVNSVSPLHKKMWKEERHSLGRSMVLAGHANTQNTLDIWRCQKIWKERRGNTP